MPKLTQRVTRKPGVACQTRSWCRVMPNWILASAEAGRTGSSLSKLSDDEVRKFDVRR
jgi:hypothetical protein